ncbi:MAG TPA: hypothetical protein VJ583_05840 [Nitrososphaeraceae archaeon]|nr:hypothetical protein [Nitrososphaeraceae archaeon]
MENEIVKQVLDFIEKTGTALFQAGFAISMKYVMANAIVNLIVATVGLVGLIFSLRYAIKNVPGRDATESEEIRYIVIFILAIGFLITFLGSSPVYSIKSLLAPEWFAVMEIIKVIK